jgi:hypothetical protein
LENIPKAKLAAASDTMFKEMMDSYKKTLEAARSVLRKYD